MNKQDFLDKWGYQPAEGHGIALFDCREELDKDLKELMSAVWGAACVAFKNDMKTLFTDENALCLLSNPEQKIAFRAFGESIPDFPNPEMPDGVI